MYVLNTYICNLICYIMVILFLSFKTFQTFSASVLGQYSTVDSGMEKAVGTFNVVS